MFLVRSWWRWKVISLFSVEGFSAFLLVCSQARTQPTGTFGGEVGLGWRSSAMTQYNSHTSAVEGLTGLVLYRHGDGGTDGRFQWKLLSWTVSEISSNSSHRHHVQRLLVFNSFIQTLYSECWTQEFFLSLPSCTSNQVNPQPLNPFTVNKSWCLH